MNMDLIPWVVFPHLSFMFVISKHFSTTQILYFVGKGNLGLAFLSKSKERIYCWLISLVSRETELVIGWDGEFVKPNCVLA